MRARASRKEAEAVAHPFEVRPERVGDARLEPADHPRAPTAQERAALPGLAEHVVEPVSPPNGEHVGRIATPDIDHVLAQNVRAQVLSRPGVEDDMARFRAMGEGLVEGDECGLWVRGRRRH